MRQLSIGLFLLALVAIGTYYLIVQQINLQRFEDPQSILMTHRGGYPKLRSPRPWPSIEPRALPQSTPSHWSRVPSKVDLKTRFGVDRHMGPPALWPQPVSVVATPVQVTPMPAPTFVNQTLPPMVQTPPPYIPGYQPLVPKTDATASPDHPTRRR